MTAYAPAPARERFVLPNVPRVTFDVKAELVKREMRVLTPGAMSNPMWFQVGQW